MKFKRLFIYSALISIIATSCKKNTNLPGGASGSGDDKTLHAIPKSYTITENFENGRENLRGAKISLATGLWDFHSAVIGISSADVKNGLKSARLRFGFLAMVFDIGGLTQIKIKHAKYRTDASTTWGLMMSTNGGVTFTQLGNDITETSTTLVTSTFNVPAATRSGSAFKTTATPKSILMILRLSGQATQVFLVVFLILISLVNT